MLHWPWLWHDTFHRLGRYLGFHASHAHYNTAWFGENIIQAPTPIAYPMVMIVLTVPTMTLLMFAIGAIIRARHCYQDIVARRKDAEWLNWAPPGPDGHNLLLFLSTIFPIALISLPNVPIFGGTKHWLPAYPFMVMIAALGLVAMGKTLIHASVRSRSEALTAVTALLLLIPSAQQTLSSHPHGLASYVPLVGGAPGAATMGMTRQFWGYTTAGVAPFLNTNAPEGARVFFHDTAAPSVAMFKRVGTVRADLKPARIEQSSFALVHHELHMILVDTWIWNAYKTHNPVHVLTYQGVPLVSVYRRPTPPERLTEFIANF